MDYLIIWISLNSLHKHQPEDDRAHSIPDQFHQSSRHKKAMSSNKQCAIQELAPALLAKQQASTAAECRSQDHPQSNDRSHKGIYGVYNNSIVYCM